MLNLLPNQIRKGVGNLPDDKEHGRQMVALGGLVFVYRKIAEDLARELLKAHPEGYDFGPLCDAAVDYVKGAATNLDYATEADNATVQIKLVHEFFGTVIKNWRKENGQAG